MNHFGKFGPLMAYFKVNISVLAFIPADKGVMIFYETTPSGIDPYFPARKYFPFMTNCHTPNLLNYPDITKPAGDYSISGSGTVCPTRGWVQSPQNEI